MIVDQVAEEKVQASSLARYVCVCPKEEYVSQLDGAKVRR